MRSIIGLLAVAFATVLWCSGVFSEERATAALAALGPNPPEAELARIAAEFPYTKVAVTARAQLLTRWIESGRRPEAKPFDDNLFEDLRAGFTPNAPWAAPLTAAVIGVAFLFLLLLLPGTRCKFLVFLATLAAILLLTPGFLQPGLQASLMGRDLPLARDLLPRFAQVAMGTILAGGVFCVLFKRRSAPEKDA
jgi:hypothetical protein